MIVGININYVVMLEYMLIVNFCMVQYENDYDGIDFVMIGFFVDLDNVMDGL